MTTQTSFIRKGENVFFLVIVALTAFCCLLLSYNSYQEYRTKSRQLYDDYLQLYKARLQSSIFNIKILAENQIYNIDNEIKADVFYRVQEAIDRLFVVSSG